MNIDTIIQLIDTGAIPVAVVILVWQLQSIQKEMADMNGFIKQLIMDLLKLSNRL